ncbi:MAG: TonB-dependent receptor [Asticcacaulis sp.]
MGMLNFTADLKSSAKYVTGVSGLALIWALGATTAMAQSSGQSTPAVKAEAPVEEIVVTGRRNVAPSLVSLRQAQSAVADSLTQAQIEAMPDTTLAQTLDRIVGVSSDRGFGTSEGRTVTIRGFDARYNSMTVDGAPVWNSSRNNRGTQLDVFPASVVAQVDVFKTVTPGMDANSIGGHIAMRTLRAFDGGTQPYMRARALYGVNDQSGKPNDSRPAFRVEAGGKFTFGADKNYGVVLGVDYQQNEFYDNVSEVTGYSPVNGVDVLNGSGFRGIFQRETSTLSAYGKLEARATDQFYAFASLSFFDDRREENWNRGGVFTGANRVTNVAQVSGTFTGATAEQYFETYDLDRQTLQFVTGFDYRLGALSALTVRASYLDYEHNEALFRSERFQLGGLAGAYQISDTVPGFALNADPRLSNPASWVHRTGRDAFDLLIPHQDKVSHFQADYRYNSHAKSEGFGFEGGLYARRLDRSHDRTTNNWRLASGKVYTLANAARPGQTIDGVTPTFIDHKAYRDYMVANGTFSRTTDDASDYTLIEDVLAAHATAIWDFGDLRLQGGVRVEKTQFENATSDTRSGKLAAEVRNVDYTNWLPNLQASYDFGTDVRLRAAATRTLARPDFSDFAFGQSVTLDGNGYPVISGANPRLEPRIADNLDLSLDWYRDGGFVSIGLFRKVLKDETFRQRRETRNEAGIVTLTETIPLNTGDARVNGLEVSFVQDRFDNLPAPFDGLGLSANYTLLQGKWDVVFTDGSTRSVGGLRNQPKWLANLNLTYNKGPFEALLAYRLRGRTFTGTFGTTAVDDQWVDAYERLDLSASYDLGGGLKLTGQVRNLNEADWIEQSGVKSDSLRAAYNPGRTVWVGVTYKPGF